MLMMREFMSLRLGQCDSLIIVVPPANAALVPWKKSSAEVIPWEGFCRYVLTSIPPGMTIRPLASMVFTPPGTIKFSPICLETNNRMIFGS
jgi:hypothetical protein